MLELALATLSYLAMALAGSCPPIKTVPYACKPDAKVPSDCVYGAFHGSFSLLAEYSSFCPQSRGFTGWDGAELGCLYTKTGTEETFCFQGMVDLNPKSLTTALPWTGSPLERPCLDIFNTGNMTDLEKAGLCCGPQECQENAGCFLDEVTGQFRTYCQCYLGHKLVPLNITDVSVALPVTGECRAMEARESYCTGATCVSTEPGMPSYRVCPYCQVYKDETSLGSYTQGRGIFEADVPEAMEFRGSTPGCPETYTGLYWYCWYNVFTEVMDLEHMYLVVEEADECEHYAYIYTPLACPFARQA